MSELLLNCVRTISICTITIISPKLENKKKRKKKASQESKKRKKEDFGRFRVRAKSGCSSDTHFRGAVETHTSDTHFRHVFETRRSDTQFRDTVQTRSSDALFRHTVRTHGADAQYGPAPPTCLFRFWG